MGQFHCISAQKAQQMMREQGASVVDIRDPQSFHQSHIEGAVLLQNSNLQEFIEQSDLDKPLIVYCYHGHSSMSAASLLSEKGFEEVYSLDGGFENWRALYPVAH